MLQNLADYAHYSQRLVGLRPGWVGMIMDEDLKMCGMCGTACIDLGQSILVQSPNKR
jgi:hypothetical protein